MTMDEQKFHHGDLVRIAKDLGQSMRYFESDRDAIVVGSYSDQYGGDDTKSYTLHLEGRGPVSWYSEHQLTLIEENRRDLLIKWRRDWREKSKAP